MRRGDRGVVIVACGERALNEAELCKRTVREHSTLPIELVTGDSSIGDLTERSRDAKTRLHELSPFAQTLYLDADTRVQQDINAGFAVLGDGWDMALTFSSQQDDGWLWHVTDDEREFTLNELGSRWLQLQCGVMFWRRNAATDALFRAWHEEWQMYRGQDQAAFLRAMKRQPVRLWLLGRPWNGGAVIEHRFGRLRGAA